ncbi:MAG: phage tail assembly protein [Anaerolineae bacterium]|nr:phage tail assembly protein [Anaerolineae bacterium]MBN8620292.1 phage tail assembly protein [Anaerolineae bacterium]
MTTLQTEFEFVLPKGYIDSNGVLQREGVMRMATAIDEITPLRDPRVRNNEAYLVVMLLAQVITRLGTLEKVTPAMVEQFYAADIAYLQDLYQQINDVGVRKVTLWCPNCGHEFEEEIPLLGES